ncbi:hypothetical protein [Metabacillus fastidiosus]|uniref:hypothetical protein n=1 Tax=Metabacillus fastidiosus TaxID=1458 RepID=UPI002E1A4B51|nr:hypothetical protein [Metabacillus fastidiosus]
MKNIDLNSTLNSIGKTSFVENFDIYSDKTLNKNEKVQKLISKYSSNGATIRVSFAEKIFENDLQIEALKNIINSRVSKDIKDKAQSLIHSL